MRPRDLPIPDSLVLGLQVHAYSPWLLKIKVQRIKLRSPCLRSKGYSPSPACRILTETMRGAVPLGHYEVSLLISSSCGSNKLHPTDYQRCMKCCVKDHAELKHQRSLHRSYQSAHFIRDGDTYSEWSQTKAVLCI